MQKRTIFLLLLVCFGLLSLSGENITGNQKIKSFSKAKKFLHSVIYSETIDRLTFYCGCSYDSKKNVDQSSCGYVPGKDKKRAKRVEWEHIVPAAVLGESSKEWKYGSPDCVDRIGRHFKGRKCASKMNRAFQLMQADMYNLVPAIGEINSVRSDFSYGEIPGEKREFGKCDFEIDNGIAEPADSIKGDIARIYMYMNSAYPGLGIINEKNRAMFEKWNLSDPPDEKECRKGLEIEKIQGNQNSVLKKACETVKSETLAIIK